MIIGTILCVSLFALSLKAEKVVKPLKNSVSSTLTPVQSGINKTGNWFVNHISFLSNLSNIKKENDELRTKVEQLDARLSQMEKEETELKRLRKLLDMSEKYSEYPSVAANVIGRGPQNWFDTIVIDKGAKDGIEEGMNVLSGDGLVGIIIEVQDRSSQIMSIIDDESNVSAMSLKTSDIFIVNGNEETMQEGYIGIKDIDKNAKVKEGDEVITSNISSKYLAGMTIGRIKDIKLSESKLSKTAKLEPAVDFKHLQEVLIIKKLKFDDDSKKKQSETSTESKSTESKNTENKNTESKNIAKEEE